MANGITQRLIETIEENDWKVTQYMDGSVDLEQYSPAGEDFMVSFCDYDTVDNATFIDALRNYVDGFDPEEHATGWYGENNGEPSSLRDLLDDAEYIKNDMLMPLLKALEETAEFNPDDPGDIQRYYEENYDIPGCHMVARVLDYAFEHIEDRKERIEFLDYMLEDFKANARIEN